MSLSSVFDLAGMGMSAQTIRLNTIASNIANAESASSSPESTYKARHPIFKAVRQQVENSFIGAQTNGVGIEVTRIVESAAPAISRYEPNHPLADSNGNIYFPNVNIMQEMADMISASRSFQTNIEMLNTVKQLMQRTLTLGQ